MTDLHQASYGAISPLDGRYFGRLGSLNEVASEAGLIRARLKVEARWLLHLGKALYGQGGPEISQECEDLLESVSKSPPADAAEQVKSIEKTTNHDVKAVEYYLRDLLKSKGAGNDVLAFIHFGCTSEDINNLAYALILDEARRDVMLPAIDELLSVLNEKIRSYKALGMLSRTHGQSASPTTVGKELAVFAHRISRQKGQLVKLGLEGKMNGAVGNYNAHIVSFPDVDWPKLSRDFIEKDLGLVQNPLTTQIENHDSMIEYVDILRRLDVILIGLCRDMWSYISIGYFSQKTVAGEVGSSTMPHKVNPIDFENGEGNFGIAVALGQHFAEKLPISRWQRDLSDSTVQRSLGTFLGHTLLGMKSLLKGLNKVVANEDIISADLKAATEVLAEPVQMVMRRYGVVDAYEQLKAATRGQAVTGGDLKKVIENCQDLPQDVKQALAALTPHGYVGIAEALAEVYLAHENQ